MPTTLGSIRRLVLTPSFARVTFTERGFPVTPSSVTEHLESIPHAVLCGFEWGIDTHDQWELERRLSMVRPEVLGFAYEGATMACTVLDAMRGGTGGKTAKLLSGPGAPHIFLAYIGIGFAMARLPRKLWRTVVPDLAGSPYHPTMSWLAVDGYGFDRAYFDTRRWIDEQAEPAPYPWAGRADYFPRAFDQGVGRALWFINGGVPEAVAAAVDAFAEARRPDLWSGVGLAATFAGGAGQAGLATLRRLSGEHHAELALGVVFAIKARTYSTYVPEHSRLAAGVLADLTVEAAEALADRTEVPFEDVGPVPPYELWRARIRAEFGAGKLRAAG